MYVEHLFLRSNEVDASYISKGVGEGTLNNLLHPRNRMELNAFFYVLGDFFEVADICGGDDNLFDAVAAGGDSLFF